MNKILVFVIVIVIVISGCSGNNCPLESTVTCNYYFYDMDGTQVSYGDAITISALRGAENRKDTIINQITGKAMVKLPMAFYQKTDTLVFDYAELIKNDTIIVTHDSYVHVDLPECGNLYFHHISDIQLRGEAAIDHIELVEPMVNYEGKENVRIYFNGTVE